MGLFTWIYDIEYIFELFIILLVVIIAVIIYVAYKHFSGS